MLRWLTSGESHGPALVGVIEGLPADVVARLVPQAVRDAAIYREIATVTGVMISPKRLTARMTLRTSWK